MDRATRFIFMNERDVRLVTTELGSVHVRTEGIHTISEYWQSIGFSVSHAGSDAGATTHDEFLRDIQRLGIEESDEMTLFWDTIQSDVDIERIISATMHPIMFINAAYKWPFTLNDGTAMYLLKEYCFEGITLETTDDADIRELLQDDRKIPIADRDALKLAVVRTKRQLAIVSWLDGGGSLSRRFMEKLRTGIYDGLLGAIGLIPELVAEFTAVLPDIVQIMSEHPLRFDLETEHWKTMISHGPPFDRRIIAYTLEGSNKIR